MRIILLFCCAICIARVSGQTGQTDSLKQLLAHHPDDTAKVMLLRRLGRTYLDARPDSCYFYGAAGLALAERLHDGKGKGSCLSLLAAALNSIGEVPQALTLSLRALQLCEGLNEPAALGDACNSLGIIYYYQHDYRKALVYYLAALKTTTDGPGEAGRRNAVALGNVGEDYLRLGMLDSCHFYTIPASQKFLASDDLAGAAFAMSVLGDSYRKATLYSLAMDQYRRAIPLEQRTNDRDDMCHSMLGIAAVFKDWHFIDSAALYARKSVDISANAKFLARELDAVQFLADLYGSAKDLDSAWQYLKRSDALRDSLYSQDKLTAIQIMTFQENIRQQQLINDKRDAELNVSRNRERAGIAAFIPLFFLFVLFLSRRRIKSRVIKFLAVVGLLLAFEFITDIIFPYISSWTNDSPLWETVILVAIAAGIELLNYQIERWINRTLIRSIHL